MEELIVVPVPMHNSGDIPTKFFPFGDRSSGAFTDE